MTRGFVLVMARDGRYIEAGNAISNIKCEGITITECVLVAGASDIVVAVDVEEIHYLGRFVVHHIQKIPAVKHTTTMFEISKFT